MKACDVGDGRCDDGRAGKEGRDAEKKGEGSKYLEASQAAPLGRGVHGGRQEESTMMSCWNNIRNLRDFDSSAVNTEPTTPRSYNTTDSSLLETSG